MPEICPILHRVSPGWDLGVDRPGARNRILPGERHSEMLHQFTDGRLNLFSVTRIGRLLLFSSPASDGHLGIDLEATLVTLGLCPIHLLSVWLFREMGERGGGIGKSQAAVREEGCRHYVEDQAR